jgi:hypothetical protein
MEELIGDYGRWDGDLDLLPMALAPDTRSRVAADNERCAWRARSIQIATARNAQAAQAG